MTDLMFYPTINAWWARLDARHYRIERDGDAYIASCGAFTGRGTTLAAAVKRCALCCARPRITECPF